MTVPLVLDTAGLDGLTRSPSEGLRAMLAEAHRRDRDVLVPAPVVAEVARGRDRAAAVESALAQRAGAAAPVSIINVDLRSAKQIGAILHAAGVGSEDFVDGSVVAVCAAAGGGLVITSDPDDIRRLSQALPATRIAIRSAS